VTNSNIPMIPLAPLTLSEMPPGRLEDQPVRRASAYPVSTGGERLSAYRTRKGRLHKDLCRGWWIEVNP
jgi:hypothetical protein